jgi:hypothetical protein
MRSPLETLKRLPWLVLFQVAILTALAGCLLEYALLLGAGIPPIGQMVAALLSPAIGWIVIFVVALGVGAVAVIILERFQRIVINASSLWALVACVALVLGLGQAIGLFPLGLIGISYEQLIGILLGIFFKGQPYWKSYRRW